MSQIKLTPLGAPPAAVPEPKAWPLKRLIQVTAYVAILTLQTLLLPFPFDALASIGLFVLTLLAMMITERLKKAPAFFEGCKAFVSRIQIKPREARTPKATGTLMDQFNGSAR